MTTNEKFWLTIYHANELLHLLTENNGMRQKCVYVLFSLCLSVGFVVGHCGLYQAIAMFLVAYFIISMTVLSVCAISTNGALDAGGAYCILTRVIFSHRAQWIRKEFDLVVLCRHTTQQILTWQTDSLGQTRAHIKCRLTVQDIHLNITLYIQFLHQFQLLAVFT